MSAVHWNCVSCGAHGSASGSTQNEKAVRIMIEIHLRHPAHLNHIVEVWYRGERSNGRTISRDDLAGPRDTFASMTLSNAGVHR